jgi:hypothetical protein
MLKIQHVLPFLLLTGCAVRQPVPATWRLAGRTLMPPGVAADLAERTFTAPNVPPIAGRSRCAESDAITIQPRRRRLVVTVRRDALLKQPRGWLTNWTEQGESMGCVAPGQGAALAARILESIALPSGADLRLLRADDMPNYVEIGAGNRLQVISPMLRAAANAEALEYEVGKVTGAGNSLTVDLKSSPPVLIGVETAWYDLRPKTGGRGFTIVASSAETNVRGKVEGQAAPARNYFQFAPEMGFYRLFYKADESEVLAAAGTRAGLPTDPETCDRPGGPVCLAIPRGVGVNPYMFVNVNGNPVGVGIGTDLRGLLRTMRLSVEKVLPTLAITKLWGSKPVAMEFDRGQPDVLNLVLTGNEQIRW